jgi:hypothetical protein
MVILACLAILMKKNLTVEVKTLYFWFVYAIRMMLILNTQPSIVSLGVVAICT